MLHCIFYPYFCIRKIETELTTKILSMKILLYTILALTAASVGSVILSGSLLLLNNKWLGKVSSYLLYLAGGTLLGSALLGLIPEATETLDIHTVMLWLLIGLIIFFLLEKIILWRTCHNENCEWQIMQPHP